MTHRENWRWATLVSTLTDTHTHFVSCAQPAVSCRQGATRAAPCEAQGSRGHARRDGAHPGGHAARGADRPGAVEAAAPPLLQCELLARTSPPVCVFLIRWWTCEFVSVVAVSC